MIHNWIYHRVPHKWKYPFIDGFEHLFSNKVSEIIGKTQFTSANASGMVSVIHKTALIFALYSLYLILLVVYNGFSVQPMKPSVLLQQDGSMSLQYTRRLKQEVSMSLLEQNLQDHHANMSYQNFVPENMWGNIYNGNDLEQSHEYLSYASLPWVNTICEVGFAGGHSTVVYLTANPTATIYSFDDYGKEKLTSFAYSQLKQRGNVTLFRGNSVLTLPQFAASHPNVFCDVISVDGAHHGDFPERDMTNLKYISNYPNIILVDDYHKRDWPSVFYGMGKHVKDGAMKLHNVSTSSITFRGKEKQWAVAEYQLLTVVCATMQTERISGLKSIIRVSTQHPVVQQVIVIWNGVGMPQEIASLARAPLGSARVTVIQRDHNSLNNRYDPSLPIHTGAVLILDDDIEIWDVTITKAFEAWKMDHSRLYSFGDQRSVTKDDYTSGKGSVTNFLLPRMIFHKKFLAVYFSQEYSALREYVDVQEAHCDDIAFSSVVTKYTGKPMVRVQARHRDGARQGLGHQKNRKQKRAQCSSHIIALLGWTMPPIESI